MPGDLWLPNPPDHTQVAGGFDGSLNDDHTVIKLETRDGLLFTPRYGPDRRPTIWKPEEWGGRIPRQQVHIAWAELTQRYRFARVYCDPGFHDETDWSTEIEDWAARYGDEVFVPWETNKLHRMYPAIRRFEADLANRVVTHDGCPTTTTQMGNARKVPKPRDQYTLGKPAQHQKIDCAVTSVICHEAAADARADGWPEESDPTVFVFR